jgi:hypothetical protein
MNIPNSHKVVCLDKEEELLVTYGLSSDVGDTSREYGVYFWSASADAGEDDVPDYVWLLDHENVRTVTLEPFEDKLLCFFEVTSDLCAEFPVNGDYTALSQNAARAFAKFFNLKIEIKTHSDWTPISGQPATIETKTAEKQKYSESQLRLYVPIIAALATYGAIKLFQSLYGSIF